jgi:hypothetical protein
MYDSKQAVKNIDQLIEKVAEICLKNENDEVSVEKARAQIAGHNVIVKAVREKLRYHALTGSTKKIKFMETD